VLTIFGVFANQPRATRAMAVFQTRSPDDLMVVGHRVATPETPYVLPSECAGRHSGARYALRQEVCVTVSFLPRIFHVIVRTIPHYVACGE
jgi:hypothetical protein